MCVKGARTALWGCREVIFGITRTVDRGSEYAVEIVQKTLIENGFTQSMSGKGNCYDNAVT